jgi:hypothetical protein
VGASRQWRRWVFSSFLGVRSALTGCPVLPHLHSLHSTVYPHLYAQLEGENVEDVKELVREKRGEGVEKASWDAALEKAEAEGWLQ